MYVCENYGELCVYGLVGDSLDVALVTDGESVEVASRDGPSTYATPACSGRRVFHVDGDGQVLGVVVLPRSEGTAALKPTSR